MISFQDYTSKYLIRLKNTIDTFDWKNVEMLAREMRESTDLGGKIYICGNGGSAANAAHIVNDLVHPDRTTSGIGLKAYALTTNDSLLSAIANDNQYENIFAWQLSVYAAPKDILIVLSGSGNSPNIIKAVETANNLGMRTYGILGYDGGATRNLVNVPIHIDVNDMQVCEDMQLVIGHVLMRYLFKNYGDYNA